jgi:hypothetical protein
MGERITVDAMTASNPLRFNLVVPAALRADANRLAAALGYQPLDAEPGTFSIDMGTHYGASFWGSASFRDLLTAGKAGTLPQVVWADFGLTRARVAAVLAGIDDEVLDRGTMVASAYGEWDRFTKARGLTRVEPA